ncbi:enhancer of polycomb homolog 2 [Arachis ipaensis]|uniref:enhancer of polycomb homolog 2 n=1 Tax=Arachis ipaensis TaxID=130454 RepID=UPI000A2B1057|nr:enhancer of polycomb homolog 2 [Arachis ipaensis]
MTRLSFRPRPLDIHKKLPIVKSVKEMTSTFTCFTCLIHYCVHPVPSRRVASEIPTPQFVVVDTYERDYSCTFAQPNSYLRARGARAEIGEFVEYDLDNEDEDWLFEFNKEKKILMPEMFEALLFKLEVLDHKARERAGVITPTLGSPIPVLLRLDGAIEALQAQSKYTVIESVYDYWKEKRERWQKPILRRLQPPPPSNDTNPYNVFRPREKAHRFHTRRMQRRENNVQSFEKLRQVRRNLEQAKSLVQAVIKREEKKREVMDNEVMLQRIQMKYKHETKFLEDSLALSRLTPYSSKFVSSEEEFFESDNMMTSHPHSRPSVVQIHPSYDANPAMLPAAFSKQEFRRQHVPQGWPQKLDPLEPVLLFTKPLLPDKLHMAGIVPPSDTLRDNNGVPTRAYKFHGRIGRGGRIIFDRWNPLMQTPIDCGNSYYMPPKPRPSFNM